MNARGRLPAMTRIRFMAMALAGVVVAAGVAIALNGPSPAVVTSTPGASRGTALATQSPNSTAPASVGPSATPIHSPSPSPSSPPITTCKRLEHPEWSVARQWDEAVLNAIRNSLPNPPVHARNLFHLSVGMWDAWAAYDPVARGYVFQDKLQAADVQAARSEAISHAAYRILTARFATAVGGVDSLRSFKRLMRALCYDPGDTGVQGDAPAAVGNRIAAKILRRGMSDGSNEAGGYGNPAYTPVNDPLVLADGGTTMVDPNRWQPLQMAVAVSQNGLSTTNLQTAIGTQWGSVDGFGELDPDDDGLAIDPGPQPLLGDPASDQELKDELVELIRDSSLLDPAVGTMIDISPGARGANPLGTNDGTGHPVNPATGRPYAPRLVNQADFFRVIAQFWADGPASETPPGHWNVIANDVGDELGDDLRIGGQGPVVDRLEWDVKLYLALNGAVHNAAIAAWGLKGHYDSSRPISLIRYMGGLGQSSNPDRPSYDPEGLPLVPGLIEVITPKSAAEGARHYRLRTHVGEIAIKAWNAKTTDWSKANGSRWMLATRWMTYQLPTFVTPAFAGYVSGHSTFSRAAAEVMTAFTGDAYFPGGSSHYTYEQGALNLEYGPENEVTLEWATYFDAADQAGQSRLFGGIHIEADDFTGRIIGSACGRSAWTLAEAYYAGAVPETPIGCQEDPQ